MMKTIEGYTYKINQHIGKGYSSTVHKGQNDKTGQQVSIKVIQMAKLEDPINQMLLQHEITALKKLSFSSGVLHLYDVYATKNNTYIVTQLCDGDLGNLLKKRKSIPYPQAVQIIKQIINGYLDVYNSGYLHRDIKPANIFYKGNQYKIGDFGFAIPKKQLDQHKNYNVGSPVYMPPQALKDNIYSVSCDTWAIGIIFYQIIKGLVPWRAISEQKLHQKILTQPLDQLTLGLPQVARAFLSKTLNLDSKMRMTIQQMVNWPCKLAQVDVIGIGQQPSCSPLRQIKNQNNLLVLNINEPKMVQTPKQLPTNHFRFIPQPPPTQKHINSTSNFDFLNQQYQPHNQTQQTQLALGSGFNANTNTQNSENINPKFVKTPGVISTQNQQIVPQQTIKNATNLINYLNFLHRVVKFISPPCNVVQLPDLINSITNHLFFELDLYVEYVKIPTMCSFDKWESFLSSQKGTSFKTSITQCKAKFKMFHAVNNVYQKQLTQDLIKQGITRLIAQLDENAVGNQKSIIGLDYLTTLYQLWHIKNKHPLKQFLKMSKIDMIIQGNPYNVNVGHLAQIKRKLLLIDIVDVK